MFGSLVGWAILAYAGHVLVSRARRALSRKPCDGGCARCPWAR